MISAVISHNSNKFNVNYNNIEGIQEFDKLEDAIDSIKKKQCNELTISLGSHFGDMHPGKIAEPIKKVLKDNAFLTSLNLSYNSIREEVAESIAEALKTNETLADLNLSHNGIDDKSAELISEALKANRALKSLDLSYNNLIGHKGAGHIAEALKVNGVLTTLNLSYNRIWDNGAGHIAEALKVNGVLTTLNLNFNNIGDDGAFYIGEALKINSSLTSLSLSYNNISLGILHITEALKVNMVLRDFNLYSLNITNEIAFEIAKALKINTALTTLDLSSSSNIGDDGVEYMIKALDTNSSLTTLNWSNDTNWVDKVSDKCQKEIFTTLESNYSLVFINREYAPNYKQAGKYVKAIIDSNNSIFVRSNGFSVHYYAGILEREREINSILKAKGMNSKEIKNNFNNLREEFLSNAFRILGICKGYNPFLILSSEMERLIFSFITSQDIIELSKKLKDEYKTEKPKATSLCRYT